jgi:ribA/ribD-fused uncharacterized protein
MPEQTGRIRCRMKYLFFWGRQQSASGDVDLNAYLLGSRSRILVEASPLDRIWGIGMAADDDHVAQPHLWKGLNLLGFALMEARARLAEVR